MSSAAMSLPQQAWDARMSNGQDPEWSFEKRQRVAQQFSLLGKIGFYIQLALLVAPALLTVYVLLLRGADGGRVVGIDLSNYLSFGSLLMMLFTTYWFFRYIQLGKRIRDPTQYPPRPTVVTSLWVGLWAGCLGVFFSMLLLLAAAWRMLFVLLTNPQSGILVAPNLGTS